MKTITPIDGTKPLANPRHEAFCQAYVGECWGYAGRAYRQAGYNVNENSAKSNGWTLLTNPYIGARVKHLRAEHGERLGVDRAYLMERRLEISKSAKFPGDKLAALRDMERALGLDAPLKVEHTHDVTHRLDDDAMTDLRAAVAKLIAAAATA